MKVCGEHALFQISVSQTFLLAGPLWLRKITADSHIRAHTYIESPDDGYAKLKIYISEMILDSLGIHII